MTMGRLSSLEWPNLRAKMLANSKWEDDCLLWQGRTDGNGYGDVTFDGERYKTHRAGLQFKLGRRIKKGHWSCHARCCPNKNCWAPDHLYEGTPQTNRDDDAALGKVHRGEQIVQSVLTAPQVLLIRRDSRLLREVAADYGISEGHVSEIRHRKKWTHLE